MEKSLIQGRRFSQPANQIFQLSGVHFQRMHASTCPIRLVKLRGTVDFQRPKRQYPERPGLLGQYLLFMSQSIPTGYIPPGNPRGFAQKNCPGGRDLTFESCPGAGNSTRAGILWKVNYAYTI